MVSGKVRLMAKLSLAFDIFANNKASRPLKDVGDDAERTGKKIEDAGKKGGGFGSSISGAMKAAAGAFAAYKVKDLFVGFVQGARDAASVTRVTEQIIKSTGGTAGVSADQVTKLAESMSLKSGIDDEIIQKGANLLLTFKNVRNAAGEGANVFDRAAQAATDLSAAGFGSVESASTMLGKALNDPLAGITALGRAGVTFTDQQKEQIKALAESGDLLSAQKIILDEVGSQVGGAAEAAADPIERLKSAGRILLGEFEGPVLAAVNAVTGFVTDRGVPALSSLGTVFTEKIVPAIRDEVIPRLQAFGGYIRDEVVPRVQALAEWIGRNRDFLIPFVAALGAGVVVFQAVVGITRAWAAAQTALNAVMAMNPVGLVIIAIAALVAALVMVYQRSEAFRNIVDSAWARIREAVATAWEGYIKPALTALAGFVTGTLIPAITWLWQRVIVPAFQGIAAVIGWAWNNVVQPLFKAWWAYISNVLIPVIQWLWTNVVQPVFKSIGDAISIAWNNVIKPAFEGLKGIVETLYGNFETARTNVGKFIDKIKGFTLPSWVKSLADTVKTIADGIGGAVGGVARFFGGDAPAAFRGTAIGGGQALARVRSALPAGLAISSTYRSAAQNRAVGGHPTSLHMDRANPAVDIAGPTFLLDRFAAQLAAMGGWRQLLWRVAGHYDHIHVAHNGGVVSAGWPRMPGDRWDERTTRLQVGEVVVPKSAANRDKGGDTYVTVNVDASSLRSVADLEQLLQNARRLSRQKNGVR